MDTLFGPRAAREHEDLRGLLNAGYRQGATAGRRGKVLDQQAPGNMLRRACRRAGLVDGDGRALVSWHGLRHTAASLMFTGGAPLRDAAAQLRHTDPSITARVPARTLGHDRQAAAAAVLDNLDR